MIPDGTVFWGVVLKQLLLGVTAFAIGVLLYRTIFFERRRHRPFLAAGFLGVAIIIGVIAEVVVRAPLVDPDLRAILYVAGLALTGIGFLGDAIRSHKRESRHRRTD